MFDPTNEQGVIVLFTQQAARAGIKIIEIHTQYPDAVIEKEGQYYRVEFEYLSSNFLAHNHDPFLSDLIVCYKHDWTDCPLPVIELKNPAWPQTDLTKDAYGLAWYWRERALKAEKNLYAAIDKLNKELEVKPLKQPESSRSKSLKLSEQKERILFTMKYNSDITMTQLAQDIGTSRRTLYRRLDELKNEGLVKINGAGYKINS